LNDEVTADKERNENEEKGRNRLFARRQEEKTISCAERRILVGREKTVEEKDREAPRQTDIPTRQHIDEKRCQKARDVIP